MYEYLRGVNDRAGEKLQVIVVDNDVPESMKEFVRLALTDNDRLIPVPPIIEDEEPGTDEAPEDTGD